MNSYSKLSTPLPSPKLPFSACFRYFWIIGILSVMFGATQSMASDQPTKHVAQHLKIRHKRKIARKHIVRYRSKKIVVAPAADSKPVLIQNNLKMHTPRPGAGGEERSDWFWRRRAWPNQTIDPSFYPNALAEAARMPVLSSHIGKDGVLSSMIWQSIGPYSIDGRVSCIATHPTDSNTFYIGAAAGGLWETTDHGSNWTCVTDTFGSLSIGCVTIDPVQPETIYIGLGECNTSADSYPGDGLWKTTNGGNTWQYLGFAAAQYIAKILIDPSNHNNIFVAIPGTNSLSDTNRGVFRSTDGGATWSRSLFVRPNSSLCVGVIDIAMDPLNSSKLVAYAWDHSTPFSPNFIGGSGGPNSGIYLTGDTGNTWARIDTLASSGLPNGEQEKVLGRGALLWTFSEGDKRPVDYLFAGYIRTDTNPVTHILSDENFEGLYLSMDQGMTWKKILDSTIKIPMGGVQGKDSSNITNAQGGYDFYLTAGPIPSSGNPDIYLGGIDIFRSTDLGSSWKDITNSYSQYYVKDNREQHSDQHGLAFTASKSGTDMIVVSDGGVFQTNDFGTTWRQTTGLPITMFYAIEPWRAGMANTASTISATDLRVFGGTQDNGTVAHGLTPSSQSFATDSDFAWINHGDGGVAISHPTDSNKIISSLQFGVIFARNTLDSLVPLPLDMRDTTHDTRPRWHTLTYHLLYGPKALTDTEESCSFVAPIVLDDDHPTDLYTGRCHVYHAVLDWNDLENTKWYQWSPILAGNTTNDSEWYFGDIETIAAGVRDAAGNPMLWAGGYDGSVRKLYRTAVDPTRNDTTPPRWIPETSGLTTSIISSIVPDRSDSMTAFAASVAASSGAHVFRTTNGGQNWKSISSNLPSAPVSAIVIDTLAEHGNPLSKNMAIIAGTDVGVFVTTNGGLQWAQLGTGLPHSIVSDLKIYKNMLIASTHGRSAWALDISGIQAGPSIVETPSGSSPGLAPAVEIFPNPVIGSQSFTVHFETYGQTVTSCKLIGESDGSVMPAQISYNGGGEYRITFGNGGAFRAGAYIVQLFGSGKLIGTGRVSIVQ